MNDPAVRREMDRLMKPMLEEAQKRFFDKELICIVYSLLASNLSIRTVRRWIKNYRKMMDDFGEAYCTDLNAKEDELPKDIESWLKVHGINYDELIADEETKA